MNKVLEVLDISKRRVYLSKERWKHVIQEHSNVSLEDVRETLLHPMTLRSSERDPKHVQWFYKYKKSEKMYLLVSVKYLNGEGFIITAYYVKAIQ